MATYAVENRFEHVSNSDNFYTKPGDWSSKTNETNNDHGLNENSGSLIKTTLSYFVTNFLFNCHNWAFIS